MLSFPSPECNTKAATDYSSQCAANYFFWPCWFVSCKTAALEWVVLIRYLQAECKYTNLKLSVSKWNPNLYRLVFSVCVLTAAELIPCSLSFFDLYPEIFPFSSLPNVSQLFFSHLSILLLFPLVSLLLVGVVSSSDFVCSLAI